MLHSLLAAAWKDSVSVGWLQDLSQSVFSDDKATSGSYYGFIDYVWGKMLSGWKRRDNVMRQIGKWLNGMELDRTESDSAIVRNWDAMPKE